MKKDVPPIKVWIWVMITFFLFQLMVIIYYLKPQNGGEGDTWFSSQLRDIKSDFTNNNKAAYQVIIIGSSLTGNAVECPDEIIKTLANYPSKNILLKKIWQPHDPLQYFFKDKNLVNELLQVKPDLVCIQTELAAIRYEESEKLFYDNFKDYLQDLALHNTKIFNDIINGNKPKFINCVDNFIDYEVVADTIKYIPSKRFVKKYAEIEFAWAGLNQLRSAGIKIVLVDIPRPKKVEQIMKTESFLKELNLLLGRYHQELGIEHWSYTDRPMYFKDCYDGGHLNKAGRHVFTKNLLEKIIKEMEDK